MPDCGAATTRPDKVRDQGMAPETAGAAVGAAQGMAAAAAAKVTTTATSNTTATTTGGSPAITVSGLTYSVHGSRLINGIDLEISPDGLTVVMGPNGAGKSLLLRLLHGLIEPSGGEIRWAGKACAPEMRKRQAMVFQRPVLLRRSVAANVDFALRLHGSATAERRNGLLEHVGLLAYARQPARLLSGGEQQRLALARALATDPSVLFLDEATASLDPASTHRIETIVADAQARGTKIIFVTHDIGQARRLASDVVFLNRGRLAEHTPATTFFTNPASEAAAGYLDGRIVL